MTNISEPKFYSLVVGTIFKVQCLVIGMKTESFQIAVGFAPWGFQEHEKICLTKLYKTESLEEAVTPLSNHI